MLTGFQTKKWTRLFNIYDIDNNGVVDQEDFELKAKAVAKVLGIDEGSPEYNQMYAEVVTDWNHLQKDVDSNKDGQISLDEWLTHGYTRITSDDMYETNKKEASAVFKLFDLNGDGSLSREEYCNMLSAWGVDEKELEFICSKLDLQGDSALAEASFIQLLEQFHQSDDPDLPGNYMFGSL